MILIEGNNAGEFYTTWNVYCFQPFVLPTFGSSNRSYKVACTFHLGHVSLGLTPTSTRCFISRSSRSEIFCKKDVLRNFANLQESTCARVYFLIKLQASDLKLYWKRDAGTGVFLWILREHFFYRTSLVAASVFHKKMKLPKWAYQKWKFLNLVFNLTSHKLYLEFCGSNVYDIDCIQRSI